MIQIEREKLEKVLDALEDHDSLHGDTTQQAITIIKDVLAQPDRHELQAKGEHPAPCARHCEATAFNIEIRRLTSALKRANSQAEHFEREWYLRGDEIERLKAQKDSEPVAWLSTDSIGERYLCFDKPLDNDPVQPLYTKEQL